MDRYDSNSNDEDEVENVWTSQFRLINDLVRPHSTLNLKPQHFRALHRISGPHSSPHCGIKQLNPTEPKTLRLYPQRALRDQQTVIDDEEKNLLLWGMDGNVLEVKDRTPASVASGLLGMRWISPSRRGGSPNGRRTNRRRRSSIMSDTSLKAVRGVL